MSIHKSYEEGEQLFLEVKLVWVIITRIFIFKKYTQATVMIHLFLFHTAKSQNYWNHYSPSSQDC